VGTTKLDLPGGVAELLAQGIANVREEWAIDRAGVGDVASRVGVLPLMLDFGGFCGIKADGTFVEVAWDSPDEPREVTSPRIRDTALKIGSERYPFLAELLPVRPPNARRCPQCGGSGIHPLALAADGANIVCWCGGLGWIPDDWEEPPPRQASAQ
jgi:hypothetical protein